MKGKRERLAAALISVLLLSSFSACQTTESDIQSNEQNLNIGNSSESNTGYGQWDGSFPISKETLNISIFAPLSSKAADSVVSYDELIAFQELEKRLNVDIEWRHPPIGKENDQFSLMIASRDLPDLIYSDWLKYAGGPEKAISDKIIIPLNDLYTENSVYLRKIYEEYPAVYKCSITDTGNLYAVQNIVNTKLSEDTIWSECTSGPQYRKDWAEKVGYTKTPQTMDDWYELLTLFKENDCNGNGDPNDEIPLIDSNSKGLKYFYPAFGILKGFYMEGDQVSHCTLSENFKSFVETMRKWYAEGLLDPDYISTDSNAFQAKVTGDIAGAYIGSMDGNFGQFTKLMEDHPTFELAGAPWPMGTAPDHYTEQSGLKQPTGTYSMAITTTNQNPELSFRFLDACFEDSIAEVLNFGVEGVSYEKENDTIKLTQELIDESADKAVDLVLSSYAIAGTDDTFPTIRLQQQINAIRRSEVQNELAKTWMTGEDCTKLIMPPITPSVEESAEIADILSQVNTYMDEMVNKFIMNQTDMSEWDGFIENIKKMGIERAVEIENQALERYNNR